MANSKYTKIQIQDLLPIIDDVAVDIMMVPCFSEKKMDGTFATLAEVSAHNSLIAMHNEGIREMARMLKARLMEGDGDE